MAITKSPFNKRTVMKSLKTKTLLACVSILIGVAVFSCKSQKLDFAVIDAENKDAAYNGNAFEMYSETIPSTEVSFDMVSIPQGKFTMGSPTTEVGRKSDEDPMHIVQIDSFFIGKHEVTWEIFELFFKQNEDLFVELDNKKVLKLDAISRPSSPYEDPSKGMGKENYPAVSMSAYSALVFCKWLSSVTGRFYRLPTEAEWEYAARAGTDSSYSFGETTENINEYAVYYENANNTYAKVGSKKPNPWGLYDMHGNVAEWTMDEYKENAYAEGELENPWQIPQVIHPRTVRGGSWDDDADKLRSAARSFSSLKLQKRDPQVPKSFWWYTDSDFIGFRLVSPKNQPTIQEQQTFWQLVLDE